MAYVYARVKSFPHRQRTRKLHPPLSQQQQQKRQHRQHRQAPPPSHASLVDVTNEAKKGNSGVRTPPGPPCEPFLLLSYRVRVLSLPFLFALKTAPVLQAISSPCDTRTWR